MLYRIIQLLRALFDALLKKIESPQALLHSHYQELQSELIEMRQLLTRAVAEEVQTERQLLNATETNKDALKMQLSERRKTTKQLKARLHELEIEVQKTYTKQQVLIARDKASGAYNIDLRNRSLSIVVLLLLIWMVIGMIIGLKHTL